MVTEQELKTYLTELKAARSAALKGQSYSIKGRSVTRASLTAICDEIRDTEKRLANLSTPSVVYADMSGAFR